MAMAAVTIEQISPELVLVDPELAKRVRAEPRSYGPVIPCAPRLQVAEAVQPARGRTTPWSPAGWAWLAAGALVLLVGMTLASQLAPPGSRPVLMDIAPAASAPDVTTRVSTTSSPTISPPKVTRSAGRTANRRLSPAGSTTVKAERLRLSVERRLLHLLPSEVGRLVTRTIVDPGSGMLLNNVRVSCRAAATARTFRCSVFAPSERRVAVLSVRALGGGRMLVRR
jgi:hypothetical protein